MKFIRKPIFQIVTCRCGTIFEPEVGDEMEYKFKSECPWEVEKIFAICPTCESRRETCVIGKYDITCSEKGGE